MSIQSIMHQIHGLRVPPRSENEIADIALVVADMLGFTKNKRKKLSKVINEIEAITIDPMSEEDWEELTFGYTKAHFEPSSLSIRMPESTYIAACNGEPEALSTLLHELGHAFLLHGKYLHKSDTPPEINECAEWQADLFADKIMEYMGYNFRQLSLDLGL